MNAESQSYKKKLKPISNIRDIIAFIAKTDTENLTKININSWSSESTQIYSIEIKDCKFNNPATISTD